jgi:hypothetical protein
MEEVIEILTIKNALKLLVLVIMFGYFIYTILLSLRIRILAQTLKTKISKYMLFMGWVHCILVSGACLIIGIMILK